MPLPPQYRLHRTWILRECFHHFVAEGVRVQHHGPATGFVLAHRADRLRLLLQQRFQLAVRVRARQVLRFLGCVLREVRYIRCRRDEAAVGVLAIVPSSLCLS